MTDAPEENGYAGTVRSLGKGGTDGTDGIERKTAVGIGGTDGTAGMEAAGRSAEGSICCGKPTDTAAATAAPVGALEAWGVTGAIVSLATKTPFVSTVATTSTATVTTRVFWPARRWKKRWCLLMLRRYPSELLPDEPPSSPFKVGALLLSIATSCARWR
jgi:hypothetical protein